MQYESSVTKFLVIHKNDLFRKKNNIRDELCILVIYMTHLKDATKLEFHDRNYRYFA